LTVVSLGVVEVSDGPHARAVRVSVNPTTLIPSAGVTVCRAVVQTSIGDAIGAVGVSSVIAFNYLEFTWLVTTRMWST